MVSAPFVRRVAELELELEPALLVGPPSTSTSTVERELGPGVVGVLRAGDRTVWRFHETLRKVSDHGRRHARLGSRPWS